MAPIIGKNTSTYTLVMEAGRSGRVPEIPFDWTFKDFKLDKNGRLAGNEPERPPPTKFLQ